MEKSSIIELARGLYLLRYKRSAAAVPPTITFESLSGQAAILSVLANPGAPPHELRKPGDVVALTSTGPLKLRIRVEARDPGGSTDASIDLEPLNVGGDEQQTDDGVAAIDGRSLTLVGHVSRRGDIAVAAGEWIAGPTAPAPIEGIQIRIAGKSTSLLEVQCMISGDARWSQWRSAESFVGTKGHARPLTGLRIRLLPSTPNYLTLQGSALFLGSAVVTQEGRILEFVSAANRDPLIGLRLSLDNRKHQPAQASHPSSGLDGVASRSRVRVFRAGAEVPFTRPGSTAS